MAYRGIFNCQRRDFIGERLKAKIDVALEPRCTSGIKHTNLQVKVPR